MWQLGSQILWETSACSFLQSCLSSPICQVFHGVRKGKQQGFDKDSLSLLLPSRSFATTPPPASQLPEHRAQGMFLSSISKAHISTLVFLTSSLQKLCFLIWTITTSTQQPPCVFYSRPNDGSHVPLVTNFSVHIKHPNQCLWDSRFLQICASCSSHGFTFCPSLSSLYFSLSFFCAICWILTAFSDRLLLCYRSDLPSLLSLTTLFKNLTPKDSVFTHGFFHSNYHYLTNYDLKQCFWRQSHAHAHAGLKNPCVNKKNDLEFLIFLLLLPNYMRVSPEYGFTYSLCLLIHFA